MDLYRRGQETSLSSPVPEDFRNYTESARWFRKAAEQGHIPAQMQVGYSYFFGQGVSKDRAETARWFRLVADQGVALAQLQLGMMYLKGDSIPKNYAEAARWFRKAARQGQVNAMEILQDMQRRGMLR